LGKTCRFIVGDAKEPLIPTTAKKPKPADRKVFDKINGNKSENNLI